jgi:hypothetical protein
MRSAFHLLLCLRLLLSVCRAGEPSEDLLEAAASGSVEAVRRACDAGADKETKDARGRSALVWAARKGNTDLATLLIDRGASLESVDLAGNTPLLYATRNGHLETARLLTQRGALLNARDKKGHTALDYARASFVPLLCGEVPLDVCEVFFESGLAEHAKRVVSQLDVKSLGDLRLLRADDLLPVEGLTLLDRRRLEDAAFQAYWRRAALSLLLRWDVALPALAFAALCAACGACLLSSLRAERASKPLIRMR